MRILCIFLLLGFSSMAVAADAAPTELQALPPPPRLDSNDVDADLEPQVTIVKKKDTVVEEYRMHGKLYMIKVTPKIGPPYYLIDDRGDGEFNRHDGPDAANMRPPRWVIFSF